MHYYIFFFFFLRLLLCLKFKPPLRCAYVRYFNLCPESLDAKTGQFASLLGWGWEGWGGVFCGISIIFVYLFTYLHIYTLFGERCRSVVLYLVVFCYGFRIHQYFFVFFLCLSSVSFWGSAMLYLHLVSAVRPSRFSSYCIDLGMLLDIGFFMRIAVPPPWVAFGLSCLIIE